MQSQETELGLHDPRDYSGEKARPRFSIPPAGRSALCRFFTGSEVNESVVQPDLFELATIGDTIHYKRIVANYAGNGRWFITDAEQRPLLSADWGIYRFPAIGCLARYVEEQDSDFPLSTSDRFSELVETVPVSRAGTDTLSDKT